MEKLDKNYLFRVGGIYQGEIVSADDERLPKRFRQYRVFERQVWECIGRTKNGAKFRIIRSTYNDNRIYFIGRELSCKVEPWYDGYGHYEEVVSQERGRYGHSLMAKSVAETRHIQESCYTEPARGADIYRDDVDGSFAVYTEDDASQVKDCLKTIASAKEWCRRNGYRVVSVKMSDND